MDGFVEIPVPQDVERHDEETLRRYFQDQLDDSERCVADALDLTCDHAIRQAVIERVNITRVAITGHSIELNYLVELTAFRPCKDVLEDYSFSRAVTGQKVAGIWRFMKYRPEPGRSTHDEL